MSYKLHSYEESNLSSNEAGCIQFVGQWFMPFLMEFKQPDGSLDIQGLGFNIMYNLARLANNCYNYTHVTNYSWRTDFTSNQSVIENSIPGLIYGGKYDMVVNPSSVLPSYRHYLNYTQPFLQDKVVAVFAYPQAEKDPTGFIKPFDIWTWIASLLILVATIIVAAWVTHHGSKDYRTGHSLSSTKRRDFLYQGFLLPIRILFAQAYIPYFPVASYRIFIAMLTIGALILRLSYQCNLNTLMILPKLHLPFKSFHTITDQNEMPWMPIPYSQFYHIMKNAEKGTLLGKLWDGMYYKDNMPSMGQIGKDVANGKLASLLAEFPTRKHIHDGFAETGECQTTTVSGGTYHRNMAWLYGKNETLHRLITKLFQAYVTSGILDKLLSTKLHLSEKCLILRQKYSSQKARALAIQDLLIVFAVWVTGMGVSTIVFAFEMVIQKSKKINNNPPDKSSDIDSRFEQNDLHNSIND